MSVFVHAQGIKTAHAGGGQKFQIFVHVVVEWPRNRNQNHLLCAIVSDCMNYPEPKFLILKNIKN